MDDIQAAIAEAVAASDLDAIQAPRSQERNGTAPDAGATPNSDEPTPVAPGESQSSRAETPSEGTTPEASTVQEDDVPTSYWGVDLSDIPADKRKAIIDSAEQQESYIKQLQAKLAEEPAPAPAPEPEPEVTDEDILRAYGLDPEDWETQKLAPVIIAQARAQMQLEAEVEQMRVIETGRQAETAWNRELDSLEETYGKLPFSREDVLRHAVAEGIQTPYELYFKVSAPVRQEVQTAANAARRVAEKREAAGLKPRSQGGIEPNMPKDASLRDIVKEAAMRAEKETGLKWSAVSRSGGDE